MQADVLQDFAWIMSIIGVIMLVSTTIGIIVFPIWVWRGKRTDKLAPRKHST